MIGMILCGGYGKRFYPLTQKVPKLLLEIKDDYTILDRQLFAYKSAGFEKVVLLTGHLGKRIEARYKSRYRGLDIEYAVEKEPLGTLNAIRLGMEKVKDDVVVSNGDVITDINLKCMVQEFELSGCQASMFVVRMRSPYGIVVFGKRRIESFKEKPLLEHYINGGFYCLSRKVLPLLQKFKIGNIEKTAFPRLAEMKELAYYKEDVPFWASIDSMKDLESVRKKYENRTDKPWGYEKLLSLTKESMEKELYIMAGYKTSFHYHKQRDETLNITSGAGYVEFEGRREKFKKGSAIPIKPSTPHTIVATENTLIREVSTPHPEDVVRIKDFYEVR
ncbi:MAG: glucose-1-phosphate adenylyltransferase [Hadesarchaea archaeon CG08_land_8_20_14_0_20_51_8]|jgi:NDP-sugar pyrophosphorylase family protein|nr:MAG: glucose-1-phosphate adenylyltransferase [Hadesarchaea archaeon CG08_land_8_20_14_0_20_51_8]